VACSSPINPAEFVERVQPLLARQDLAGLLSLLKSRWTKDQLKELLTSGQHHDARKVAMLALALVGGPCCVPLLAEHLKDKDLCSNQMAEHALWSIWFRSGTPEANAIVAEGAEATGRKEFSRAERLFTDAIEMDPTFAEPYNQRAIVRYLTEQYEESIADCRETVKRMPVHFGAWAGMGHCHAHLGRIADAIRCYSKALEINPHMGCVAEGLDELRRQWREGAA
jgi:tetratricopeptide (TPR) repeat protein